MPPIYSRQTLWWGKHIAIGAFSVLFLLLGIDTLVSAYQVNNPHEFIMYFFASNLIILVSAVGILFCVIRLYYNFRPACETRAEDCHEDCHDPQEYGND